MVDLVAVAVEVEFVKMRHRCFLQWGESETEMTVVQRRMPFL